MDIMVECGPPPWLTVKDAILVGKALEPYNVAFYEDAVAPENLRALARLQDNVDVPIAVGERHSHIWGLREHIERELVDVIQPDAGRVGGISQLKKLAAMAEAHYITVAPHSGTLGPVGEYAALHVMASIPNALALERVEFDDPVRYEVIDHHPPTIDGHVPVPDRPGLGVDIIEEAIEKYPSTGQLARSEKSQSRRCTNGSRARTSSSSTSSPGTAGSPPCLTQGSRSYQLKRQKRPGRKISVEMKQLQTPTGDCWRLPSAPPYPQPGLAGVHRTGTGLGRRFRGRAFPSKLRPCHDTGHSVGQPRDRFPGGQTRE